MDTPTKAATVTRIATWLAEAATTRATDPSQHPALTNCILAETIRWIIEPLPEQPTTDPIVNAARKDQLTPATLTAHHTPTNQRTQRLQQAVHTAAQARTDHEPDWDPQPLGKAVLARITETRLLIWDDPT